MRALWSYWSRPHELFYRHNWHSEKAHILSWALSFACAEKHYEDTCLITDDAGAALLVDRLGLPFKQVNTSLEALNTEKADPNWWVLGKLNAYAAQHEAFVHLDADVYLWSPLPVHLVNAPVFAQNPESFLFSDQSLYRVDKFMQAISELGGWLPDEWRIYARRRRSTAICCGILGGRNTNFISRYARLAQEIISHPDNQAVWKHLGVRDNILVEQYFLAACLDVKETRNKSAPAAINYLFASAAKAFDPVESGRAGYTHLIGAAKRNEAVIRRLEHRVQTDHPKLYERCMRLSAGN